MKKFILIASLLLITQNTTCAVLSDAEITTPEYLINSGYSTEMADMVTVQKARSTSTEYNSIRPVKRCKQNKVTRFFRRCLEYIDPALDDDSFYNHDIIFEPNINDF